MSRKLAIIAFFTVGLVCFSYIFVFTPRQYPAATSADPSQTRLRRINLRLSYLRLSQPEDAGFNYQIGQPYNSLTYDVIRIREQLPDGAVTVYIPDGNKTGSTSAAIAFYLPQALLTPEEIAEYVITSEKDFLPETLTPDNERLFLFKE